MVSFSTLPYTMAPSLPFPIGIAFSQVLPDGLLYHNFKPGLFCEILIVATSKKMIDNSGFIMLVFFQKNKFLSAPLPSELPKIRRELGFQPILYFLQSFL